PPMSPTDCNAGRTPTPSTSTASRRSHAATLAAIRTARGPRWADARTIPAAASAHGRIYDKVARARLGCVHGRHPARKRAAELHPVRRAEASEPGTPGVTLRPAGPTTGCARRRRAALSQRRSRFVIVNHVRAYRSLVTANLRGPRFPMSRL